MSASGSFVKIVRKMKRQQIKNAIKMIFAQKSMIWLASATKKKGEVSKKKVVKNLSAVFSSLWFCKFIVPLDDYIYVTSCYVDSIGIIILLSSLFFLRMEFAWNTQVFNGREMRKFVWENKASNSQLAWRRKGEH